MVRATKKKKMEEEEEDISNPESSERKRLKELAFSNSIISETPWNEQLDRSLAPSKTVLKHSGKDILKKSTRKNRFLFSFPGLLAPVAGGKIGDLKDLGSKNPILYLDFPQGRMKLFGTIVYPQNRYLTLQFSRGGKNVMCEDCFDNMVVFSDAWWIGSKDENPEEARLDFPKELIEEPKVDYDFKGGAGGTLVDKHNLAEKRIKCTVQPCKDELEDDTSDSENNLEDINQTTPLRNSERTAGKRINFAESSSEGDSVGIDADKLGEEEEVFMDHNSSTITTGKRNFSNIDNKDIATVERQEEYQVNSVLGKKSKSNAKSSSHHASLVQATISTLFKKVEEKKVTRTPRKSPSAKVSGGKSQQTNLKRKIDQAEGSWRKNKVIAEKRSGEGVTAETKESEIEEDDIEEFSSQSRDADESDEDWVS